MNEVIPTLFAEDNIRLYKEDIRELKHIAHTVTRQGIINALEGMKERPNRERILQLAKFPVLFIIGKKDRVVPFDSILKQTELVKDGSTLILEDAGHMGFIEEKKRTQESLILFARKCFR